MLDRIKGYRYETMVNSEPKSNCQCHLFTSVHKWSDNVQHKYKMRLSLTK